MLSISLWHVSGVIWSHSSATFSHNSWTPFGGIGYSLNLFFKCTHKCLIGLRFKDWVGHRSTWILLSSNHLVAFFEVCFGSLSCWKILSSSSTSNFSKLSTTPSSKILQYYTAFIVPSTSVSFPTPFQLMHPHTMRLFPPPCLTVDVVVLSESGVPFSFYTLPSDPILLIFISSDHRTLFQSSTVQFSCFWANLRQFCWWVCLNSGCFCLTTEWKFLSLSAFLTVWGVTGEGRMSVMKWAAWTALSSFPVVILWIIDCLLWEESLEGQPPLLFSLSKSVLFWILPTVNLPKPVLDSIWWTEYPSLKEKWL